MHRVWSLPLAAPVQDRLWHRALMKLAGFRAWALGGVYTAGAAAIVISEDDALLLVKPWYRSGWGLPGGFMKHGEQAAEAVRRELMEETGLTLEVSGVREVYVQHGRRHIDHVFLVCVGLRSDTTPHAAREITAARWYARGELPPLQKEAHEALRRVLDS